VAAGGPHRWRSRWSRRSAVPGGGRAAVAPLQRPLAWPLRRCRLDIPGLCSRRQRGVMLLGEPEAASPDRPLQGAPIDAAALMLSVGMHHPSSHSIRQAPRPQEQPCASAGVWAVPVVRCPPLW